jgi:2-polyprenyl-3-methyl-5-hydroxy-6-metoxy-1,4-benzoquinol methylase
MSDKTTMHEGVLERLDPALRRDHVATQHWARYEWAAQFLPRQRVLDCSCGVGYGTSLLRERGAEQVIGVDISSEALDEARQKYAAAGIEYVRADALSLDPAQLGTFDLIVSLETIEHVADPRGLLDVFKALLNSTGMLALSCPNDAHLAGHNPYHLWVADFAKLHGWIEKRFKHVQCFGEVHVVGTSVWPIAGMQARAIASTLDPLAVRVIDELPITDSAGFLFACSNATLADSQPRGSIQLDGIGYIRELREVCDRLWQESQTLSEENRRLAGEFDSLRERDLDIAAQRDKAQAESTRLAQVWQQQRQRLVEIEAQRDRIWNDGRRLNRGYEEQASRISELEALISQLTSEVRESQDEARRLAQAWETQTGYLHDAQERLAAFQNVVCRERDQLNANLEQFRSQPVYRALRKVGLMRPAPEPSGLDAHRPTA